MFTYVLVNYRHGPNRVACLLKKYEYTYSVRQNIILAASRGNPCWCWWRYALAPVCALLCAFPCSLFAVEWYACGSMMLSVQRNRMVYKGRGLGWEWEPRSTALFTQLWARFLWALSSPFYIHPSAPCSFLISRLFLFLLLFSFFFLLENNNQWHFH